MKMDLIKCTRMDGNPVYIALHHISAVTMMDGQTWIYTDEASDTHWVVKESVDEVVKMIQGPTMIELYDRIIGGGDCGEPEPPALF